jgi:outer membrane protein OmpA-like peptidoglycan-associated protein/YHS domain-containing protein
MKSTFNKSIKLFIYVLFIGTLFPKSAQAIKRDINKFIVNRDSLEAAQKNIRKGDRIFNGDYQSYDKALEYYLKANHFFNSQNAELDYKIGVCYLYSSFKLMSLSYLEQAKKINPAVNSMLPYYLGRAYHLSMNWKKAVEAYEEFNNLKRSDSKVKRDEVDKQIQECKNGISLMHDTTSKTIENMREFNSAYADYHPLIAANGNMIFFTSRRPNTKGGEIDPFDGKFYEDIYYSKFENGHWGPAQNISKPLNRFNAHDATCGISIDCKSVLLYLDDKEKGTGNIYESNLEGDIWSEPQKLSPPVNSKYHESSASLSPDGKTIYFCSENPIDNSGIGSHDIFKSQKDETGKWGPIENLGTVINTIYDEKTVFIAPDGKTLYFSSQGHNSMGGYDLFKSVYNESTKNWSEPVNLGYPINSPDDDLDFSISANGGFAYFTTFRPNGSGEKDIYRITLPSNSNSFSILVKGNVSDESNNPLGANILIFDKTGKEIHKDVSDSHTGQFLFSLPAGVYTVNTSASGYLSDESSFEIAPKDKSKVLDLYLELKKVLPYSTVNGNVINESGKPIVSDIEVVNNSTGKVIQKKATDKNGRYQFNLESGKSYGLVASKEGYLFQSVNLDIPLNNDTFDVPIVTLKNIKIGSNIVLNNIFFDFDKYSLRGESKPELDRVVAVLKNNPKIKIEIQGHTDNKGSSSYNLKLSQDRAKSVVDFLISAGIQKERLSYTGYGFTKPVASNDSEESRQKNRRIEFKVLSIN